MVPLAANSVEYSVSLIEYLAGHSDIICGACPLQLRKWIRPLTDFDELIAFSPRLPTFVQPQPEVKLKCLRYLKY